MLARACIVALAAGFLTMGSGEAAARNDDGILMVMHVVSPSATLTIDGKPTPLPWMEIAYIPVPIGSHRLEASGGAELPGALDAELELAASSPGRGGKPYWCVMVSPDRLEPTNPLQVVLMSKPTCTKLLETQGRN